jgi:hypothetical protein
MPLEKLTERVRLIEGRGDDRVVVNGLVQCALLGLRA